MSVLTFVTSRAYPASARQVGLWGHAAVRVLWVLAQAVWAFIAILTVTLIRVGLEARRIPGAVWGIVIVPCLAAAYCAIEAVLGYLADTRTWSEIGGQYLGGVLVCLVIVVMYWTREQTVSGSGRNKFTARRTLTGNIEVKAYYKNSHSKTAHFVSPPTKADKPKCSPLVAVHEGGHAAAVEGVGGKAIAAKVTSWGAWTQGRLPRSKSLFEGIVDDVAFSAGGEVAVHTSQGCAGDHAMMDDALKQLPWGDRGRAKSAGYSKARTAQWTHGNMRNRVAKALYTKGHWHR